MRLFPLVLCATLVSAPASMAAVIVGGWDASTNSEATGLTFSGTGTSAVANDTYIFGSGATGTAINATNGNTNITGTGGNAVDVTFRIDLDGSEMIEFDEFWVQMQRGGAGTSNVVNAVASWSTDGTTFTSGLAVDEVAVGGNGGGNDVGPYDTITSFRTPNGFGGSIGPQQVYRVSGLDAAGTLDSGSLWVRYTVGASSDNSGNLVVITDRIDLDTTAIALAAQNDVAGGKGDGLDVIWTGTIVPEPASAALVGLGAISMMRRRRA